MPTILDLVIGLRRRSAAARGSAGLGWRRAGAGSLPAAAGLLGSGAELRPERVTTAMPPASRDHLAPKREPLPAAPVQVLVQAELRDELDMESLAYRVAAMIERRQAWESS